MTINRRRLSALSVRAVLTLTLAGSFAVPMIAQQAKKSDLDDVEALLMEYTRFEDSGDMASQAKLMTADRWWHAVGGRRTDNALWMKTQGEQMAANERRYPGLVVHREVRDLKSKLVAPTVAITSFTWVVNRVIPPDLPAEKVAALGPAPIPVVCSLVWVKQPEGWKITNTHQSPLYVLPAR